MYGRMIKEIARALLVIKGLATTRDEIKLHWGSIIPADEKEQAEIAILDKQLGASEDTLLRKRGYDPENERKKREFDRPIGMAGAFDAGKGDDVYSDGKEADDDETETDEMKRAA